MALKNQSEMPINAYSVCHVSESVDMYISYPIVSFRNEQMANIFRMLYEYKFPNFKFRVCPQRAFIGFTLDDLFIEFEKDGDKSLSK